MEYAGPIYIKHDHQIHIPSKHGPIVDQCWSTVYDIGPTLTQQSVKVFAG